MEVVKFFEPKETDLCLNTHMMGGRTRLEVKEGFSFVIVAVEQSAYRFCHA